MQPALNRNKKTEIEFSQIKPYLLKIPTVTHWGTLDASQKSKNSQEANALSISLHPEDWSAITPLGPSLFLLEKKNAKFLDKYTFSDSPYMELVWNWASENGYVKKGTLYKIIYDNEGEEVEQIFDNLDEAENEIDGLSEEVQEVSGYLMTPKMLKRSLHSEEVGAEHVFAEDFAISFFMEDNFPQLDGIWWEDTYDPLELSCPRGGIFPGKVKSWNSKKITLEEFWELGLEEEGLVFS
jgi:hypothetical protein